MNRRNKTNVCLRHISAFLRMAERPFQGPPCAFIADSSGTVTFHPDTSLCTSGVFGLAESVTKPSSEAQAAAESDCLTLTSRLWLKAFQGDRVSEGANSEEPGTLKRPVTFKASRRPRSIQRAGCFFCSFPLLRTGLWLCARRTSRFPPRMHLTLDMRSGITRFRLPTIRSSITWPPTPVSRSQPNFACWYLAQSKQAPAALEL